MTGLPELLAALERCAEKHMTREYRTMLLDEHEARLLLAALKEREQRPGDDVLPPAPRETGVKGAIEFLAGLRVFVTSRERIHPDGAALFDEAIATLRRELVVDDLELAVARSLLGRLASELERARLYRGYEGGPLESPAVSMLVREANEMASRRKA